MPNPLFELEAYMIRRKVLKLFGASFHVYAGDTLVGFSDQKAFKLKEDLRVYTDETKSRELLTIRARSILDFSAAYDIVDAESGQKVGAARRKGLSSFIRDSWELLDASDQPIAKLEEDNLGMALLRRFLSDLVPQTFHVDSGMGRPIVFRQRFNPFIYKLEVEIPSGTPMDRRLIFGAAVLLAAIEGRQDS